MLQYHSPEVRVLELARVQLRSDLLYLRSLLLNYRMQSCLSRQARLSDQIGVITLSLLGATGVASS